mmetsp:Transcript_17372/g.32940  ORF Transcript_17372/g.32940 Transcript_17372/m.32940 type:complete len:344 (+) Transcript_17372:36-1067(+)
MEPNRPDSPPPPQIQCQVCNKIESLYRCPACLLRTCSLECCKSHKQQTNCSGKRDRTAFVPLHKFTDSTLSSDFHFLEDVLARSDRGKRLLKDLVGSSSKYISGPGGNKRSRIQSEGNSCRGQAEQMHQDDENMNGHHVLRKEPSTSVLNDGLIDLKLQPGYPKHKQILVQKAKERNIRLLLMPQGMQRHIQNKSKYDAKKDRILWKVEVVFHVISAINDENSTENNQQLKSVIVLDRIPETESIYSHLCKEFETLVSHSAPSETRCVLRHFRESNAIHKIKSDAIMFMKRVPCCASQPKFVKVDLKQQLREMLNGMTVIEFPSIDVVLPEGSQYFPLFIEEV